MEGCSDTQVQGPAPSEEAREEAFEGELAEAMDLDPSLSAAAGSAAARRTLGGCDWLRSPSVPNFDHLLRRHRPK